MNHNWIKVELAVEADGKELTDGFTSENHGVHITQSFIFSDSLSP